jgi:FkbM family methyltransferase
VFVNNTIKNVLRQLLPKAITSHRILSGPLRDERIITSWHDYPAAILGRTERPLLGWFAQNVKSGESWLDIGAHYGYTAIALSRLVGQQGRVFAFEPMVSTAGYVAQTRELNDFPQLIVLPLGLANPETLKLKQLPVTRGMVDSTLEKYEACPEPCPEQSRRGSRRSRRQKAEEQVLWQETIMVARLDWLWQQVCGKSEQIHGVKIDVQGMEIEVLQGMLETLRRQRPKLVVEVHRDVDRKALLDLIETAGYSRQAMPIEPVEGEVEPQYVNDRSYYFKAV